MKKKTDEQEISAVKAVKESPVSPATPKEVKGIYVYIGPSIRGLIINGSIRKGTKTSIFEGLGNRAEKYPLIKKLLIIDTELSKARQKLSSGDNAISIAYQTLEKQTEEVN